MFMRQTRGRYRQIYDTTLPVQGATVGQRGGPLLGNQHSTVLAPTDGIVTVVESRTLLGRRSRGSGHRPHHPQSGGEHFCEKQRTTTVIGDHGLHWEPLASR